MYRKTLVTVGFIAIFGATNSNAKHLSASLSPPDESAVEALHLPTGCAAQVTLSYDAFVKAQITDPKCLPKGVKARDIPATLIDFIVDPKNLTQVQPQPSQRLRRR